MPSFPTERRRARHSRPCMSRPASLPPRTVPCRCWRGPRWAAARASTGARPSARRRTSGKDGRGWDRERAAVLGDLAGRLVADAARFAMYRFAWAVGSHGAATHPVRPGFCATLSRLSHPPLLGAGANGQRSTACRRLQAKNMTGHWTPSAPGWACAPASPTGAGAWLLRCRCPRRIHRSVLLQRKVCTLGLPWCTVPQACI